MQGLTNEIVADPALVELDAFSAKLFGHKQRKQRDTLVLVADGNREISCNPYKEVVSDYAPQKKMVKVE